jgi:selenocysteine lyase/cysteine desulfurase
LKIGSFSAASNVTGIVSHTFSVTALLHRHGALSFWDIAAAAPYVGFNMNPHRREWPDEETAKDALFLSPHKFIGGPGTPGVLVVKKKLLTNRVPSVPGGGTVSYVSETGHTYITDPSHREEGGTPSIIGSIRAGLVFRLKNAVGDETIEELEKAVVTKAISSWSANDNIHILGSLTSTRLSIVSFMIRHRSRYLHHNFVVALLNDLFGIQARGGCSCAGPYGHRLLGIDVERSRLFRAAINSGCEGIKPGWVRVNFNYFCSGAVIDYILEAVNFIADNGWKLLPEYQFHADTGLWHHTSHKAEAIHDLKDLHFEDAHNRPPSTFLTEPESALPDYLERARDIVDSLNLQIIPDEPSDALSQDLEPLRWFTLPGEILSIGGERNN